MKRVILTLCQLWIFFYGFILLWAILFIPGFNKLANGYFIAGAAIFFITCSFWFVIKRVQKKFNKIEVLLCITLAIISLIGLVFLNYRLHLYLRDNTCLPWENNHVELYGDRNIDCIPWYNHKYDTPIINICLPSTARISTQQGYLEVTKLQVGMQVWSLDRYGNKKLEHIIKLGRVKVPYDHLLYVVIFEDGRILKASKGHPLANGQTIDALKVGDIYDKSKVKKTELENYHGEKTYDLLPAGDTGFYFVDGVLMGSSLR